MGDFDRVITDLAAPRKGIVTRNNVLDLLGTDDMIDHRVDAGLWQRLQAAVYLIGAATPSWHQKLLGACLCLPGLVFSSHRSAALMHGFDGSRQGPLDVLVENGHRVRPRGAILHRTDSLPLSDCTTVDGIPVTTPLRTLLDYAAVVPSILVERGLESGIRRGKFTEEEVGARLEPPARGRRGIIKLRRVLAMRPAGGPAGSFLEVIAAHLDAASADGLVRQFRVTFPDGEVVALDWAFLDVMLNLEFDGDEHHRSRRGSASDLRRDKTLRKLGWTVRRFSYADVRERPAWVSSEILAMLDALRCGQLRRR